MWATTAFVSFQDMDKKIALVAAPPYDEGVMRRRKTVRPTFSWPGSEARKGLLAVPG
jgi:hypothetical protein